VIVIFNESKKDLLKIHLLEDNFYLQTTDAPLAVSLAINAYLLAKDGQTVGKKLVGTRIVANADEQILSFGRVFGLRYPPLSLISQIRLVGSLFCLVNVLFIFRKDKRCIHDLIAGSKVVNA